MNSIKIRLFNSDVYEEFTSEDRFEIYIVSSVVYYVTATKNGVRHEINFFNGIGLCKDLIRQYYKKLGIAADKITVKSDWDKPKQIRLCPEYKFNDGY